MMWEPQLNASLVLVCYLRTSIFSLMKSTTLWYLIWRLDLFYKIFFKLKMITLHIYWENTTRELFSQKCT